MLRTARRGNDARHRGVREDPLHEELSPARALEFRRPRRQRPAARALVQTFVATNSVPAIPSSDASAPTTPSAAPYIGDESITRPPSSTNRRKTSRRGSRSAVVAPTSNVCHVPRPTAGIVSPLDG